ncbi:MAG: hypothetical protein WD423_12810, partial [Rhodothermales bacterium]
MSIQTLRSLAGVVLVAFLLAGCDLSGLDKAADDFDLIIELEEINTTVSAQVLDYETLESIPGAVLSFTGQNAGVIIDVYSDPITDIRASGGVVTFGIQNSVLPTENSPVEFGLSVEADGYLSETVDVALVDSGGNNVTVQLLPDKVQTTMQGTSGVQNSQTQSSAETGVAESVTVTTPQQNNVQASTSAKVEKGTKPLGSDGTALTGQITTDLQVFDLDEGLDAVPSQLKENEEEALLGVAGFGMSDASGKVAFDYEAGEEAGECAFTLTNEVDNEELYDAIEAGLVDDADVVVTSIDGLEEVNLGAVPFTLGERPTVVATICVGGEGANVDMQPLVDAAASSPNKVGAASWHRHRRSWWSWRRVIPKSRLMTVTFDNSANAAPQTINWVRIAGLGTSRTIRTGFVVPGGQSLTRNVGVLLPTGRMGYVTVGLSSGVVFTHFFTVPSGTFDQTVRLPTIEAQEYTVRASLSCSGGQKLSPQITRQSFSGLSLGYRPSGRRVQFSDMGKARNIQVTESSVRAEAQATLVPGEEYEFRATYGDNV